MSYHRIRITLWLLTWMAFLWQLYDMIHVIQSTNHLLPDHITLYDLAWRKSHDVFLGVPNVTLIPLLLLVVLRVMKPKRQPSI